MKLVFFRLIAVLATAAVLAAAYHFELVGQNSQFGVGALPV